MPGDTHPFLLRRDEHDLAAHDDMGLLPSVNHNKTLHTSEPLGLLPKSDHDITLHQALGLMADAEHTSAQHTGTGPGQFGLMETKFTKAKVDTLNINAIELGGMTRAELTAYTTPVVKRSNMDPAVSGNLISTNYRTQCTSGILPPPCRRDASGSPCSAGPSSSSCRAPAARSPSTWPRCSATAATTAPR